MPEPDWFAQNAPKTAPPEPDAGNWFATNAPEAKPASVPSSDTSPGMFDYHPPGTDDSAKGSFADTALRPVGNAGRAFVRQVMGVPSAIAAAVAELPQDVKDFAHPRDALRRNMGLTAETNGTALPANTTTSAGPAPKVDYDRELPNAVGSAAASYAMAEGFARVAPKVLKAVTPGGLRKMAQDVAGAGERKVYESVERDVVKAGEDADKVRAQNKDATETTLRKRGEVEDANAGQYRKHAQKMQQVLRRNAEKTSEHAQALKAHEAATSGARATESARLEMQKQHESGSQRLDQKYQRAQSQAESDNKALWDDLRGRMADQVGDITDLRDATENAKTLADPTTSPLFQRIIGHNPGEQDVPGFLPKGAGKVGGGTNPNFDEVYERDHGEPAPMSLEGGVSFERLQRWRSYLVNKVYSGGNMDGHTRKAFKLVLRSIDKVMDTMAEGVDGREEGTDAKDDLDAARSSHRQMKETFSDSPNEKQTVATKSLQDEAPKYVKEKQRAERLRKVGRYDPTIVHDAQTLRGLQASIDELPRKAAATNTLKPPPSPPRLAPTPERPERKPYREPQRHDAIETPQISLVNQRKEMLSKTAARWRETSQYQIRRLTGGALGSLVAMVTGESPAYGAMGGYVAAEMAPKVAASVLDRPKVIAWLTQPSAEEIATIKTIPNVDRVKILDKLTDVAAQSAKEGNLLKLPSQLIDLLGPRRVALIAAAKSVGPKNAGEAKSRVKAMQLERLSEDSADQTPTPP